MANIQTLSQDEVIQARDMMKLVENEIAKAVIGQRHLKAALTCALVADGHVLVESVPGLAKTTAAKALSMACEGTFSRIQCTPDLMPADITGTQIYNSGTGSFETIKGPVFANFVLLDEINRSSAKTQSAMLEAMEERQVTIANETYRLPSDIFTVIATQNPLEQEGTYPLSEAQTDRFMIMVRITYPSLEEEISIMSLKEQASSQFGGAVISKQEVGWLRMKAQEVYCDRAILKYIATIAHATRHVEEYLDEETARYVRFGVSPRASIAFMKMAKATALRKSRGYVVPEDIKDIARMILRHRIGLSYSARANGVQVDQIIDQLMSKVPTP